MTRRDVLMLAAGNVRCGGVKSLLCSLAVCVAICSACIVSGLGSAAQNAVNTEIEKTGIGGLALYAAAGGYVFGETELRAVTEHVAEIEAAMPLSLQYGSVSQHGKTHAVGVCGVNEQLPEIFSLRLLHGRMLQRKDLASAANVMIIDKTLAKKLYQRENIVGRLLSVGVGSSYEYFEVIGIIDSQTEGVNRLSGGRIPNVVYLPYSALDAMLGKPTTDKLAVSCFSDADESTAVQSAIRQLRVFSPDTEFKYENLSGYTEVFKRIVNIITIFIRAVAAVSVVVGGIGVMNSMVSAVEKRTREIGVYMALGATRKDILQCFLCEAVILCLLGGAAGGMVSLLAFRTIRAVFHVHIRGNVLACMAGAVVCGMVFGIAPAQKACRLNPMDAIRDE